MLYLGLCRNGRTVDRAAGSCCPWSTSRCAVPVGQNNWPHTRIIKHQNTTVHPITAQRCFPLTGHTLKSSFTSVTNEAQECSPPHRKVDHYQSKDTDREDGFRLVERQRKIRTSFIMQMSPSDNHTCSKIQLVWETQQKWQTGSTRSAKFHKCFPDRFWSVVWSEQTCLTKSPETVTLQKL